VERYSGEGQTERYAELARHVVNTHPDVIFALGAGLSLEFKITTTAIPIVTLVGDPVALGFAESIAQPGGNITGVTVQAGPELEGKRIGLLVEAMPKLSTLSYLVSQRSWEDARRTGAVVRDAAKRAGISLKAALLGSTFNEVEYQRVFMEQDQADALMRPSSGRERGKPSDRNRVTHYSARAVAIVQMTFCMDYGA
jgi:putative ABC transport system substrate-binding protein